MKVILQQDILKVGKEGEIVTVADGYARNYLFPRSLAVRADGGALKTHQIRQAQEEQRSDKMKAQADQAAAQLTGKTVRVTAKVGANDRLYGSITAQDIADAIKANLGVALDKRKIQLQDPIKAMGTHSVGIKLHRDTTVPVTVEVVKA